MGTVYSQARTLEIHNTSSEHLRLRSAPIVCTQNTSGGGEDDTCGKPSDEIFVPPTNDQYWNSRLERLLRAHAEIDKVVQTEYEKARAEIECHYRKLAGEGNKSTAPCSMEAQQVAHCYETTPHRSLECSHLMRSFSRCVDAERMRKLDSEDPCRLADNK